MTVHPDMSAAAQWYASQGVPVLPLHWPIPIGSSGHRCSCGTRECASPAKHPMGHLTPHGLDDATTNPETIAQWWTAHPHANIGLRTGVLFDALDLDGPAGMTAYKELSAALGGDIQALAIVRTGRPDGGRQHYVQPPHARNFTGGRGGVPPGVDCRGAGGYVVAVPSQHISGRRYEWVTRWGTATAGTVAWETARAWLTTRTPAGAPHNAIAPPLPAPTGEMTSYALTALTGECDAVRMTPVGARNAQLNDSAFAIGQLVAHGLIDDATARGALTDAARAAGLPTQETARTIESGMTGGANKPRQALPAAATSTPHPTAPHSNPPPADGTRPAPPPPDLGDQDDEPAPAAAPPAGGAVEAPPPVTPEDATAGDGGPGDVDRAAAVEAEQAPPSVDLDALALAHEIRQLRIRRQARRHLDQEEAAADFPWPLHLPSLVEDLAEPDEPTPYVIAEIMPAGANVLLTAQFKTGKTTMVNEVARALAEQDRFLNRFDVTGHPGRIVVFNFEMAANQYRRWWRDIKCAAPERITLVHLRGTRLPLLAPITQEWISATLEDMHAQTWIVDPFARAFSGSGDENSNSDVGVALDILDTIKARAGVPNLVLATHTGRAEVDEGFERARGATRLDDWADVRWILTKDERNTRYLRAVGRDVDLDEEKLSFDADTRRLTLGGGDRSWERRRRIETDLLDYVTANPGCSVRDIHDGVTGKRTLIDTARLKLIERRAVRVERDEKTGMHRHYPCAPDVLRDID